MGLVVAGRPGAQHGERFVDVKSLRVARNSSTAEIGFFDDVVPIIDVNARAAGRRPIDAASEGIVLEAGRPAAAGQDHTGHPVLVIPGVGGVARAIGFEDRI